MQRPGVIGGCILRSASFWSLLLLQEFHYGLVHHSGSGESDECAGRTVKEFLDGLIHHPSDGPARQSTMFHQSLADRGSSSTTVLPVCFVRFAMVLSQ